MFSHLHAHSHYSFLSGLIPAEQLPVLAEKRKMPAIALTDTNNVTGVIPFYKSALANGVKPIIGVELKTRTERAVLLAKNNAGYAEICETLTRVLEALPQIKPKLTVEDFIDNAEQKRANTRVLTPWPAEDQTDSSLAPLLCDASENVILLSSTPSTIEALAPVHRHHLFIELIHAERKQWPQLRELYRRLRLQLVATNDVCFEHERDFELYRLVRAIDTNTTVGTLPRNEHADLTQYFATGNEIRTMLRDVDDIAFRNAEAIVAECNVAFDFTHSKFATFPCDGEPLRYLTSLAEARFQDKGLSGTRYHDRFRLEMETIAQLNSASYFLAVWDMIQYAKRQGFPYIGRGSGANSFTAYLLGISNVDSVKYNLQFERFLNPERKMPPDFDIDFSWTDRYNVIGYMLDKYGKSGNGTSNAAMLSSIQTFRDRGAIREVGKALGYSESEITSLRSKLASNRYDDIKQIQRGRDGEHVDVREWLSYVDRLQHTPRHLAMHSGGLLLLDHPITRYTAMQRSLNDIYITQQDMHSADEWKLIKLDVLATRGLGTYWDTMRIVEERHGARPPIEDYYIASHDEPTRALIREGKTKGCFYIESPAMIGLLRKLRTDTFENLTAASSVIRPGVAQSGMMDEFIRRHHDSKRRTHIHPLMGSLMSETYGIMVYQEDVLTVVHELAGISRGKADVLRRAMSGKGRSPEEIERLKQEFIEGCWSHNNITRKIAEEIWRQISSFSGYSFCKAHSASYAVLSFQEAWLKVHYPTEFLCSVLNNYGGFYRHQEYIDEAKRLGIQVKLPDVNKSTFKHTVEADRVIRLGFAGVKNVQEASIKHLLEQRESGGPFVSIEDFAERSGLGTEEGMTLITVGACDALGLSRPIANVRFSLYLKGRGNARSRSGLLDFPHEEFKYDLSHLSSFDPDYIFAKEREYLGYSVTDYPSHFLKPYREDAITTLQLKEHIGKRVRLVGHIAASKFIRTKKGDAMCLLNISDEHGMADVVIWPELFREQHLMLSIAAALRVTGKIAENFGVPSLIAEKIERLDFQMGDD